MLNHVSKGAPGHFYLYPSIEFIDKNCINPDE